MLGPGVSRSDIKLRRGSLVLDLGGGDAIHLVGFDSTNPFSTPMLDHIEFADGTRMTYQEVLTLGFDFPGSSNNEFIEGTGVTDRIDGGDGSDLIEAKDGDDSILGGTGDDFIDAGAGKSTPATATTRSLRAAAATASRAAPATTRSTQRTATG